MLNKKCINDPTNGLEFILLELKKNGKNDCTVEYTG